jgi:flagellar biosynthetic protein FlhB
MATMQAPKVLAKGRNLLAEQIKKEARWAGVPIVENPPLARSLYRAVDVGQSIPHDLYTVVAEILAFLYRAELERRGQAQSDPPAGAATGQQHGEDGSGTRLSPRQGPPTANAKQQNSVEPALAGPARDDRKPDA